MSALGGGGGLLAGSLAAEDLVPLAIHFVPRRHVLLAAAVHADAGAHELRLAADESHLCTREECFSLFGGGCFSFWVGAAC